MSDPFKRMPYLSKLTVLWLIFAADLSLFRNRIFVDAWSFPPQTASYSRNFHHSTRASSRLYSASTTDTSLSSSSTLQCDGLLDPETFTRHSHIHGVLEHLRTHLPVLLFEPLQQQDNHYYCSNFTLVADNNEILVSSYEELLQLSTTLVAATTAARQANAVLQGMTTANNNRNDYTTFQIQCEITTNNLLRDIRVNWNTTLPARRIISGESMIQLDESNGCIRKHQLVDVCIDGVTINKIGETLASLRKTLQAWNESPLLKSVRDVAPQTSSFLEELRDGLMMQVQASSASSRTKQQRSKDDGVRLPPIYLNQTSINASSMIIIPIDDALPQNSTEPPLPGSIQWTRYASAHKAISDFVARGLPILSGNISASKDDFRELFSSEAQLLATDKSVLARGGKRLGDFYRTLASLRKGTAGNWQVVNLTANWHCNSVTVQWISENPVLVKGTDRFVLSSRSSDEDESTSTSMTSTTRIERIEQVKLVVSGSAVKDPEWFRTFFSSVERGRSSVAGADLLVDLLQQAGGKPKSVSKRTGGPPQRSESAAASVYGVLCALHRDLPALVDAKSTLPPAQEYIYEDIELRGYFDETLVSGEEAYFQLTRVVSGSLRAALATGRVKLESPPMPRVEFTPQGTIVVSLVLDLRILVTQGESVGLPLKLQVVSEYVLNDNGRIQEHRLIESRVNGQLTPGDVVSRWIKGLPLNDRNGASPMSLQSILDAVNWARNLSGGGSSNAKKR